MAVAVTSRDRRIGLQHGSGGRAMRRLIDEVFIHGSEGAVAGGIGLSAMDDGAAVPLGDGRWLVVTTDSHVIHPLFFPGGDIGRLAVAGTVNDLAMMGATEAMGLTCGIILEDGFPMEQLEWIQASMAETCREAGTAVLTGDTKVMGRGEIDGVVINTTGVGLTRRPISDAGLHAGDAIIVTGSIADHGLAILATRNGLELEGDLRSDVAPLNTLVARALAAGGEDVIALKDPTRGGLASTLIEMAEKSGVGVVLDELAIPMAPAVRGAAELLGIDPLHVANEGKAIIGVRNGSTDVVLEAIRSHPLGANAQVIGQCIGEHAGRVILDTGFGQRLLAELEGEPLPRIC